MDSEELMRRKREIEGQPELMSRKREIAGRPELLPALLDAAIASVQTLEQAEVRRMESFTSSSAQLKGEPSDKEPYPTARQMRADMVRLEDAARKAIESLPLMSGDFDGSAVNALQALLGEGGG